MTLDVTRSSLNNSHLRARFIFGDHAVSPMTGRPDHALSSVAPASHSARVSVAMMAPISSASESLNVVPKLTGLGKEVGQYTVPSVSFTHEDWTP